MSSKKQRAAFEASRRWRQSWARLRGLENANEGMLRVHAAVTGLTLAYGRLEDWTTAHALAESAGVSERWARESLRRLIDKGVVGGELRRRAPGGRGGGIKVWLPPVAETESVDEPDRNSCSADLDDPDRNPTSADLDDELEPAPEPDWNPDRNPDRKCRSADNREDRDTESSALLSESGPPPSGDGAREAHAEGDLDDELEPAFDDGLAFGDEPAFGNDPPGESFNPVTDELTDEQAEEEPVAEEPAEPCIPGNTTPLAVNGKPQLVPVDHCLKCDSKHPAPALSRDGLCPACRGENPATTPAPEHERRLAEQRAIGVEAVRKLAARYGTSERRAA